MKYLNLINYLTDICWSCPLYYIYRKNYIYIQVDFIFIFFKEVLHAPAVWRLAPAEDGNQGCSNDDGWNKQKPDQAFAFSHLLYRSTHNPPPNPSSRSSIIAWKLENLSLQNSLIN